MASCNPSPPQATSHSSHPVSRSLPTCAPSSVQQQHSVTLHCPLFVQAAPEIELPELEGKTAKMYRGGKICLTIHFQPLWIRNRWAGGRGRCGGTGPWGLYVGGSCALARRSTIWCPHLRVHKWLQAQWWYQGKGLQH